MSGTTLLLILALVFGALFGFVYLIEQRSKVEAATGRPSRFIRLCAIGVGLSGLGLYFWFGLPLEIFFGTVIILGYGLFGLFKDFGANR